MKALGCSKEWKNAKVRDKLSSSVNHMMDVVYLQKRISFLERAISVVLEEYQLKGIYLHRTRKRREVD